MGRLEPGTVLEKESWIRTNTVLQNGTDTFHFGCRAKRLAAYAISSNSEGGLSIEVKTGEVVDTISASGQEGVYSSNAMTDTAFLFGKALRALTSYPVNIKTNGEGRVLSVNKKASLAADEALVSLVGLGEELLEKGTIIDGARGVSVNASWKLGHQWTTREEGGGKRSSTLYSLVAKNNKTVTIAYNTTIAAPLENAVSNGSLLVDVHSGRILEKAAKTITVGYIRVNGIWCTMDSRTASTERYRVK